jgi:hypothetical protein
MPKPAGVPDRVFDRVDRFTKVPGVDQRPRQRDQRPYLQGQVVVGLTERQTQQVGRLREALVEHSHQSQLVQRLGAERPRRYVLDRGRELRRGKLRISSTEMACSGTNPMLKRVTAEPNGEV